MCLAVVVEHLTQNPKIGGSNPATGMEIDEMAKRLFKIELILNFCWADIRYQWPVL